ncbi:MAG: hypothetical protein MUE85_06815 [Microscillaceae bacterium]|nr:hypothetical protein [Microscillaceae bacterium]
MILNTLYSRLLAETKLVLAYALVGLMACTESSLEPSDEVLGYDYFPLLVGSYVEYAVEEQIYQTLGQGVPEIRTYQIREEIPQIFIDIEGERAFRVERFRRPNANFAWTLDSVWVAKRTGSYALRVENNRTFVKLSFPPKNGLRWNGNAFNTLGDDRYEINNMDKPLTINNLEFEKTLKVIQSDDSSRVSLDRRSEIYARGVGLISKEYNQVFYCQPDPNNPNTCRTITIDFGRIIKQRIINYGKN